MSQQHLLTWVMHEACDNCQKDMAVHQTTGCLHLFRTPWPKERMYKVELGREWARHWVCTAAACCAKMEASVGLWWRLLTLTATVWALPAPDIEKENVSRGWCFHLPWQCSICQTPTSMLPLGGSSLHYFDTAISFQMWKIRLIKCKKKK